jgi:CHORD
MLLPLVQLFIESYNKRKPDTPLLTADCHLENSAGVELAAEDIIGDVIKDREDIKVRHGATAAGKSQASTSNSSTAAHTAASSAAPSAAAAALAAGKLRCRNYGCSQFYAESENSGTACSHHIAPPIFHDTKKGWSCCEKRVYDWDEFQAIPGCVVGPHSSEDPAQQFAESPTAVAAAAAEAAAAKAGAPAVRSIEDYNSSNPSAVTAASSAVKALAAPQKCTRRSDGTAKCLNKGCQKDFAVAENTPDSCSYHKQNPVFHDTGKFWACCPDKVKYEFDDFMQIAGCCRGYHQDGSGQFENPQ